MNVCVVFVGCTLSDHTSVRAFMLCMALRFPCVLSIFLSQQFLYRRDSLANVYIKCLLEPQAQEENIDNTTNMCLAVPIYLEPGQQKLKSDRLIPRELEPFILEDTGISEGILKTYEHYILMMS